MCATTNLYREAADFLELWQECPRLRSAIRFGNESCDNSYTIIEANVTITRVNFSHRKVTRKELRITRKQFIKDFEQDHEYKTF